ncbi:MAG: radical SAM protein [Elusimicrobiota bacterium]
MTTGKKDKPIILISIFSIDFGIRSISSFLKIHGYQTEIIFYNKVRYAEGFLYNDFLTNRLLRHQVYSKQDIDLLISRLKERDPAIVGLSVSSTHMQTAKHITSEIKKQIDCIVVWGGIHAIIAPDECIRYADIVCTGEGEYPMLELADKVKEGKPISGIKNLWIKKDTEIEKNRMRPLVQDLDTLPFPDFIDRDNKILIDRGKSGKDNYIISASQKNVYPIMTSRGCMYRCAYCCNSIIRERYEGLGPYLRRRSVDNVISELKAVLRERPVHTIRFWDDVFTYDKKWVDEFCEKYPVEVGMPFNCYAHPAKTAKEILTKLRNAGLKWVNIGIQSGSEEVSRDIFSRQQYNDNILEHVRFIAQLGITICYDLILENPYESDTDQQNTVELLLSLPKYYRVHLYSLCWFPKTPLTERALEEGRIAEGYQEQYTSKALNNFHMFVQLSKTKNDMFWNCIKAMAINNYCSDSLVRSCCKNMFFRKWPGFLFELAKVYLRLRSKYTVIKRDKKYIITRLVPRNLSGAVRYQDIGSLKKGFVLEQSKWLFKIPEFENIIYNTGEKDGGKRICLGIRSQFKSAVFRKLIIVAVIPFEIERRSSFKTVLWRVELPEDYDHGSKIYFDFRKPELHYLVNGKEYKAEILNKETQPVLSEGLYAVKMRYAEPGQHNIGSILLKV